MGRPLPVFGESIYKQRSPEHLETCTNLYPTINY